MLSFWYLTLKIKLTYSLPIFSLLLANRNCLSSGGDVAKKMWRGRVGYDDYEAEGGKISGE